MDNSVQKVMQRICEIEQRFGAYNRPETASFSQALATAENTTTAAFSDVGNWDIKRIVKAAAKKYNVDEKLALAVAETESNLQPQAVSPTGAAGVMQLMPATARSLGVRDVFDPRDNIDGGIRYLKQMLNTFNGDVVKAVAAYNAGPEAVQKYDGIPPYSETRNYVEKVMSMAG